MIRTFENLLGHFVQPSVCLPLSLGWQDSSGLLRYPSRRRRCCCCCLYSCFVRFTLSSLSLSPDIYLKKKKKKKRIHETQTDKIELNFEYDEHVALILDRFYHSPSMRR